MRKIIFYEKEDKYQDGKDIYNSQIRNLEGLAHCCGIGELSVDSFTDEFLPDNSYHTKGYALKDTPLPILQKMLREFLKAWQAEIKNKRGFASVIFTTSKENDKDEIKFIDSLAAASIPMGKNPKTGNMLTMYVFKPEGMLNRINALTL